MRHPINDEQREINVTIFSFSRERPSGRPTAKNVGAGSRFPNEKECQIKQGELLPLLKTRNKTSKININHLNSIILDTEKLTKQG